MKPERRALRIRVRNLEHECSGDTLRLRFALSAGSFATTVLREIIAGAPRRMNMLEISEVAASEGSRLPAHQDHQAREAPGERAEWRAGAQAPRDRQRHPRGSRIVITAQPGLFSGGLDVPGCWRSIARASTRCSSICGDCSAP
jgi:hypothetical protein